LLVVVVAIAIISFPNSVIKPEEINNSCLVTTRNSRFTCDFPKEINPQEFLRILLRSLLLWTCFLRLQRPHENPQVTNTFAGVSPAEVFLFSIFVFFHESLGISAGIPADFPADFRMFFPTDFAALLFIFFNFLNFKIVTF